MKTPDAFYIAPGIRAALDAQHPLVALESTVITHGLPTPLNYEVAMQCETAIRDEGAVPATVGIIEGKVHVGLTDKEIKLLAHTGNTRKVSRRDFGIAISRKENGGTTVAGTMLAAQMAGINVFATGGIGGFHRGDANDISADLTELAQTPVVVVCAGAKAILDLPRTVEYLETLGVPVIGYQTETFPAFYSTSSGLPVDVSAQTAQEAAEIIKAHWDFGLSSGLLVTVAPPVELALPFDEMEKTINEAVKLAEREGIRGKAITPFLLEQVAHLTEGRSQKVNVALLEQNARIAARIAIALAHLRMPEDQSIISLRN